MRRLAQRLKKLEAAPSNNDGALVIWWDPSKMSHEEADALVADARQKPGNETRTIALFPRQMSEKAWKIGTQRL